LLLLSVDGIAQFHGIGHLSCLGCFVHSSPDGIAQFYKTCGVRKRCQKSYHHSFCSPQSSSDGIAQLLAMVCGVRKGVRKVTTTGSVHQKADSG
jgi:hypothetical protein